MGELEYIKGLLSTNTCALDWCYAGPSDKAKLIANGDNLLHLAARTRNVEVFLSIFKKSIKSDVRLLGYSEGNINPFHIAARMQILLKVIEGIFEHLNSEKAKLQYDPEKLEKFKNYVRNALSSKCALTDSTKRTPLDMVSKEDKDDIRKIAGIKESFLCNKKFHLCLYIVGTIACIATLCSSLYFLCLCSQELALASVATIASGGVACLSFKAFSEIYNSNDISTLMEDISAKCAAKIVAPGTYI
ncbi:hypothetical protein EJB10_04750 [Wolbachia endosymbiont of Brugia malayi]|uniref:hypothetical protein n=1 Tax=Wolbachia endosymbiont of Brugia malayi TaxID=80849 RepID=UPI00004C93D2|nr:hypothetical protein [Wolbachia endosymbiont of Brugia malayi]AAW71042.1 Predicted protein [Wolbachia endosymbiont strain TRS of Brugia malayi]QCB61987.1 hypothetical protein EJB10_04750 [Wolbachia endosymbiont of Brugia malayi]